MRRSWRLAGLALAGAVTGLALAGEIGYNEDFALAADRALVLRQLLPGTEEYFYYHCLHSQLQGDGARVKELLVEWRKQHNDTPLMREIQNRQALLEYETQPQEALRLMRDRLNLQFNHAKREPDRVPNYPTTLDPQRLAWSTLRDRRLARHDGMQHFEELAYERIVRTDLDPERRRRLLGLLRRADYPKLPELIVEDLKFKNSGGFGSHAVHGLLTLEQLDRCLELMPELLNVSQFIDIYLAKLRPSEDADPTSPAARAEHLDRLWAFVDRLASAHNSLKASILYRQLELARQAGDYDRERFLDYLKLPRQAFYVSRKYLERDELRRVVADLNGDFRRQTLLPPVGSDEPLVRDYLAQLLVDAPDYQAFVEFVEERYLKELFAETKIVNGIGDLQEWYNLLPVARYRELNERVDLEFLPDNPRFIGRRQPVVLKVALKNVDKLLVNIYELNTANFYRDNPDEITTAVDLDGLVPNVQRTLAYDLPPSRRHLEAVPLPDLVGPGVFVVELIGNGRSSRALLRLGDLNLHQRPGAAGHVFRVYDEQGRHCPDATLWLGGAEYRPDEHGELVVPYSNQPREQPVIVQQGGFAVRRRFFHRDERYELQVGFHLPHEALVAGEKVSILVRPLLTLNDIEVARDLLLEPLLTVRSTDREGISSTTEMRDLKLAEDGEWMAEIKVPDKLSRLELTFAAKVENLSQGRKVELTASQAIDTNQIERSPQVADLFLRRTDAGYAIDLLGRTGEPLPDRAVHLAAKHRLIRDEEEVVLKTDADGRVTLGELPEIVSLRAWTEDTGSFDRPGGDGGWREGRAQQAWTLFRDERSYPAAIQAQVGQALAIPLVVCPEADVFAPFSLLEMRGGQIVADWSAQAVVEGGYLLLDGLPAGDYSLLFKGSGQRLDLRLAAPLATAPPAAGVLVGAARLLDLSEALPLQIAAVETVAASGDLAITLLGTGPATRVHLSALRFGSAASLLAAMPSVAPPLFQQRLPAIHSDYLSGRAIGDEYRYVLERQQATKFPGNLLTRPSLLLIPWSLRETQTGVATAAAGDEWGAVPAPSVALARDGMQRAGQGMLREALSTSLPAAVACHNFLPTPPVLLANLRPDADGRIVVPRAELGAGAWLQIVAVDGGSVVFRTFALSEVEEQPRDLRLRRALPADQQLTERKRVTPLLAEAAMTIDDIGTAKVELFDSLGRAYQLFATLSGDATLAEFAFVQHWPTLAASRRRELYAKYACHELNFFLLRHDPEFFAQVVRPFIANKLDKTFMDRYLLGEELGAFCQPWAYARLNTVERILLAERLPAWRTPTARQIGEAYDVLPPDLDRFHRLFDTAIQGNALTGSSLGDQLDAAVAAFAVADFEMPAEAEEKAAGGEMRLRGQAATARPAAPPAAAPGRPMPLAEMAMAKREEGGADKLRELAARRQDVARRKSVAQLFRKLDATREWVENNYYQLPIERQVAELVGVNAFWRDYAARDPEAPFLSGHLAEAAGGFAEMMLALAVLDLPFVGGQVASVVDERQLRLTAAGHAIVFHREILPATVVADASPFLVSQNFFDPANRYRYEGNEKIDRFVRDEFVKGRIYGCQLVLTNPTSGRRKINVLQQIPLGAIPVAGSDYTKGHNWQLEPYSTQAFEYYFYFPAAGDFGHYPALVAQNETLVAVAEPFRFNVVDRATIVDTASWEYVSQNGTLDQVLEFIDANNLERLDLNLLAFRLRDRNAFDRLLAKLEERLTYHDTLWSYAVHHNAAERLRQYLPHTRLADQCGLAFASPLLTVEPVARLAYQHKEYWPLVNARVYQLGRRRQILNQQFHQQYEQFVKLLTYRAALGDGDRLALIVYLLLQDRVEEALAQFAKIDPAGLATKLQYDYLAAYLHFSRSQPQEAAAIARRHAEHPVKRWRDLFANVLAQAAEIAGGAAAVVDPEDRDQVQAQLADASPSLELGRDGHRFVVTHHRLAAVQVNYYPMDVELLFSRNPFVGDLAGGFSIIRPHLSTPLALAAGREQTSFELPRQLADRNVLVEVVGGGLTRRLAYYPSRLTVQMIPTYGQVRVARQDGGAALAGVYVKVYARLGDGQVVFYKDGYTDLRGRFDYASLSTDEITRAERFAILVLSDQLGAVVRETEPPRL